MSSPIVKLVAQRIALGILLLLAVSVLIFAGTQILPGDVAQAILGQSATPESLANLREQLGLNDPAFIRYFRWLAGVVTGDLGTAMSSGQDIATSIQGRLWNTLFLAFWAAVVAVPLAIILGLIAVRYRNGWVDKLISGLALASTSFPEFFIGYVLVYFFAVKYQIFPGISTVYDGMPFGERMQAIMLPA
ncbi:ABC transporter permease, partial [Mesorhizobium sp. M5C.F.Ca.IN.020.14.1.1]